MAIDELVAGFAAFFTTAGRQAPVLRRTASPPPAPFRALLAHDRTMTEVLGQAWGGPLTRLTLEEQVGGPGLARTVLLLSGSGRPAEFAHLRVELDALPTSAAVELRRTATPFGGWLRTRGIEPEIRIETFVEAAPAPLLLELLGCDSGALWGRIATLRDPAGRVLARSLEIPAPLHPAAAPAA